MARYVFKGHHVRAGKSTGVACIRKICCPFLAHSSQERPFPLVLCDRTYQEIITRSPGTMAISHGSLKYGNRLPTKAPTYCITLRQLPPSRRGRNRCSSRACSHPYGILMCGGGQKPIRTRSSCRQTLPGNGPALPGLGTADETEREDKRKQHLATGTTRNGGGWWPKNGERKNECTFLEHYYVVFLYVIEMCKTLQRTNIFFASFPHVSPSRRLSHTYDLRRDDDDDDGGAIDDDLCSSSQPVGDEGGGNGKQNERLNSGEKCANPALLKSGLRCTIRYKYETTNRLCLGSRGSQDGE